MRLSMWPRADVNAKVAYTQGGQPIEREDWLRETFGRTIVFSYRGQQFHFVPTTDEIELPFIAGRIGLQSIVRENEPPEAGLEETTRDRWKAIVVLMDPRGHMDGQKVAVEYGTGVAKPLPIFSALVWHIDHEKPAPPYNLEVKSIADASTFWEFVERNRGEVTSVTFEFLSPNMFGIDDDMDREAAELKRIEKVQKAALTIESENGLNLDSDRVKQTVKYTTRGGGDIKAKAKHDSFQSNRKAKRVKVPEESLGRSEISRSLRSRVARAISYVFKDE